MLSIRTQYGYLDLGEISISFVLKSPIFNDADGSYAYNFNVPASDNNRKIFGFPHRIEGSVNTVEINAEIAFNGLSILSGVMLVKECSPIKYECSIGVNKGDFNWQIKDKMITQLGCWGDMLLGDNSDNIHTYYEATLDKTYPDTNFVVFPVQNDNIMYGIRGDDDLFLSKYKTCFYIQNYWKSGQFPQVLSDPDNHFAMNLFTPFVYHSYVLEQIISETGYEIEYNIFRENSELNSLVFFNTYCENSAYYYTDPLIGYPSLLMPPNLQINLGKHVPETLISTHLDSLRTMFGAVININPSTKKISIKLIDDIIQSNDIVEFSNNVQEDYTVSKNETDGFELTITPDSNDTYWSENVKSIDSLNLKDDVVDHTVLPANGNEINDVRLCVTEQMFYVWNLNEDTNALQWDFYSYNYFEKYQTGTNKTSKEAAISTVLQLPWPWEDNSGNAPTDHHWLIPLLQQKGIVNDFAITHSNKFSDRLLFYRGMQKDKQDNLYPMGSFDVYSYPSTKINEANIALRWEGPYGLIENFWKNYINFMANTKIVKFSKYLTPLEFKSLDFSKKYRINEQNYLLKEVRVTITNNEIKLAEIDAYTV